MATYPAPEFQTRLGKAYCSTIEEFLASPKARRLRGRVDLILTSPPFPLVSPKAYGNRLGSEYRSWIVEVCRSLGDLLSDSGSLVMEIGNTWEKGQPTMSLLPLKTLMAIAEDAGYEVCQQFIWENTAKLPGPATYVNIDRIRLKDSHTNIWWYSKSSHPKADNRKILTPYKDAQKKLMASGKYNAGMRPSEHRIGEASFLTDNGGAIRGSTFEISSASEVASVIRMANTSRDKNYYNWCTSNHLPMHPARMPVNLAKLFIEFLTDPGDLIFDPFGGSCTTGQAAEELNRKWLLVEMNSEYLEGGRGRFSSQKTSS